MKHAAPGEFVMPANDWWPRDHQMKLWKYLQNGGDRAVAIWHRRAGKDEICLHHAAMSALRRVGNVWHCLPEYQQARKSIWTAINAHTGRRRIDEAFPPEIRDSCNDNEMFIRLKNGSTFQCIGSDRYDATVGSGPMGITYSEYALANPSAWAYHRPMLQENGGWAVFISTPRGHNHAKTIFEHAQRAHGWFAERLTAEQTGALTRDELAEALGEYQALYGQDMGTAAFDQEYLCSFNAAIVGAYYAREMAEVRNEGRITAQAIALDDRPVHRAWDLGVGNDTSIWWFQMRGAQLVILDHYAASGVGVEHYAGVIEKRQRRARLERRLRLRPARRQRQRMGDRENTHRDHDVARPAPEADPDRHHRRRHSSRAPHLAAVRVSSALRGRRHLGAGAIQKGMGRRQEVLQADRVQGLDDRSGRRLPLPGASLAAGAAA